MGKQVAILGGGVAGLTAAHELLDRGFDVTIYEKDSVAGGKARSYRRKALGSHDLKASLPAEHGFRFFPGFYKHLPDTMKRIPFNQQPLGVFENLVPAERLGIARENERTIVLPLGFPSSFDDFYAVVRGFAEVATAGVSPLELAHFADRMIVLATSSDERRVGEYENCGWIEFIQGALESNNYRRFLAIGATRSLVACHAEKVSARTGGLTLLQLLYLSFMSGQHLDRLLNGPTSEMWLDPWFKYLQSRGLKFVNASVEYIACKYNRIAGVKINKPGASPSSENIYADYYIAALPIEVMKKLITKEILKADSRFYDLDELETAWMNGIQFYLHEDVPILKGHTLYIDSPWALTSVSQQQFWHGDIGKTYGDGKVHGILSVDISDWNTPGFLYGLAARECSRSQIKDEVWAQLKKHLNVAGSAPLLLDSNLVAWQLDRDISCGHESEDHLASCMNLEPLLINTVASFQYRPDAVTGIANFFLASDYVRTNTDLATMEGANEAARRAVAGVLDASGSLARKPDVWPMLEPPAFDAIRGLDRFLYNAGLPHPLDRPVSRLAREGARCLWRAALWTGLPQRLTSPSAEISTMHRRGHDSSASLRERLTQLERQLAPGEKIKVAILGGGMSSIATAYMLTRKPEGRRKYEVTIYQQGWRLGGKGASGRNAEQHDRIEEHGLHIWFGFYDNAFTLMRECYDKVGRTPAFPLSSLEDAFKPCNYFVVYENFNNRWIPRQSSLPTNNYRPGDYSPLPTFWDIALSAVGILVDQWKSLFVRPGTAFEAQQLSTQTGSALGEWARKLAVEIGAVLGDAEHAGIGQMLELAHKLAHVRSRQPVKFRAAKHHAPLFRRLLDEFNTWFWRHYVKNHESDDSLRNFSSTLDTVTCVVRGLLDDRIFERGFDSINNHDFKQWLRKHGAQEFTLSHGVLVRMIYDAAFAYRNGDTNKPDFAAGVAVSSMLRVFFTYKGAFCYKMQAGMGDAVFAPFYQLLRRRGVNFEFFNSVSNLSLSEDRKSVDSIEVIAQAELKNREYSPLVKIKGLSCWPNHPIWEQLKDGENLGKMRTNFEESRNPHCAKSRVLKRGEDFDLAVLGIPVAALPEICKELIQDPANPRFKEMIEKSATTMTQAFQLWINQPLTKGLGWSYEENSIMSTYVEPIDTYCNMSHLIEREGWTDEDHVQSIAYFCGVLKDSVANTQETVTAQVNENAREYLKKYIADVWPDAVQPGTSEFNWEFLVASRELKGPDRLNSQFVRGNFQPTERYVLTPAGSVDHRLRTDESGYDNLFLTGDWIRNGFNTGCIESAVISGMQTARAITGSTNAIVGEDPNWLREI
jgi:uncharacterized protein with NAD-binding domain and iron-sulfur cluster